MRRTRRRLGGQTIVLLALVLGIIMIIAALVIDVGATHRVRAETHYVCDAASLAGIAEWVASRDAGMARARALEICRRNGYVVGQNGVTHIRAYGYNHATYNPATGAPIDPPNIDRYYVEIARELPQYIANIIGIGRTGVFLRAVSALLGSVPIDVSFGQMGFPDRANLAQFGPDAPFTFGDPYSTRRLDNGQPNELYNPLGYRYDLYIPPDVPNGIVRIEIFDPDTINDPAKIAGGRHVVKNPSRLQDTNEANDPANGLPTEPELGGLDEIRRPPPNGNGDTAPGADFVANSTQTEWTIVDGAGNTIARATYGPRENTPFYLHREDCTGPPHTAVDSGNGMAQLATDLKWITPQGFQFDATPYRGQQLSVRVRTVSGSSENGFTMRMSTQRAAGQHFVPGVHNVTPTSALAIYGYGRVPINFSVSDVTQIPIGEVPSSAKHVIVNNFDTDVGSQSVKFGLKSFDATTGQGDYPVLFPAPANATGSNVVTDTNGNKYYTDKSGTLSPNGQWRTDNIDIPESVVVPRTDGNGNLVFNAQGRIEIVDSRPFEGGSLTISYTAGAHDTSVWEVSFQDGPSGDQQIVLIR